MRQARARVVFWDFDGTLARREGRWSATLATAARTVAPDWPGTAADLMPELSIGFPWHSPEVVAAPGDAAAWWAAQHDLFAGAYARCGLDPAAIEQAIDRIPGEYYRPSAWAVDPLAREALSTTARAGYRNAVLSNHAPEMPQLATDLGIAPLLETTITSAAVGAEKPNRRIFEHALRTLGVTTADDVWMVGDNPEADIAGAEAAGLRAVLVTPSRDLAQAAAFIVAS